MFFLSSSLSFSRSTVRVRARARICACLFHKNVVFLLILIYLLFVKWNSCDLRLFRSFHHKQRQACTRKILSHCIWVALYRPVFLLLFVVVFFFGCLNVDAVVVDFVFLLFFLIISFRSSTKSESNKKREKKTKQICI